MADSSPRVALLARPGEACERLRAAVREAGGDVVIEADPSAIDPQALRIAAVETVLVALDPAVEDALEKFDDVLADRAIEVIFDEADLAARREGWDAARWVRHLAAKLHRHDDVLPPGREPDADVLPRPGRPETPEDRHADADIATFVAEADTVVAEVPREEPIALASMELEEAAPVAVEMPAMHLAAIEEVAAIEAVPTFEAPKFEEPVFDDVPEIDSVVAMPMVEETTFSFDMPVEEVAVESSEPAYGALSFTDDLNAMDFESDTAPAFEAPAPSFDNEAPQDLDALLRDLGEASNVREFAPKEDLPSMDFDIAPVAAPTAASSVAAERIAPPSFKNLSLEALTDTPHATTRATDAPATPQFLDTMGAKISSLALVGHGASSEDHHGVVLILAGIGGPDAVRQILTALPIGFPRAVLISQRLDGGRYDRLVQQMARAATLPVHLAEPSTQLQPGNVYIVPPELGLDGAHGLNFAQGFSLMDALPSDDSAVLMLSGADPMLVDTAMSHAERGALVAGQSPDGCYDAAAPMALNARGATVAAPQELVQSLLQRWPA